MAHQGSPRLSSIVASSGQTRWSGSQGSSRSRSSSIETSECGLRNRTPAHTPSPPRDPTPSRWLSRWVSQRSTPFAGTTTTSSANGSSRGVATSSPSASASWSVRGARWRWRGIDGEASPGGGQAQPRTSNPWLPAGSASVDTYVVHLRILRTAAAPVEQRIDVGGRSLEVPRDRAVRLVGHPPGDAEARGLLLGAGPEEHALHPAGDHHVDGPAAHDPMVPPPIGAVSRRGASVPLRRPRRSPPRARRPRRGCRGTGGSCRRSARVRSAPRRSG